MSVLLKDSNNTLIHTFPAGCELIDEPFNKRLDTENRAYQHGGIITSDSRIAVRIISLHGIFDKSSQALMKTELNSMKKACYTEDLRLYATQNSDDYYNVECLNFEHNFLGMLTAVEINIDFQCSDPFRYYKDETTDSETGITSSPHNYTVANGGDAEVFPVITFTGGASTNLTKIRVANAQDGGRYFEVTTAIGNADVVEVDCEEGTIEKNGSDIISSFSGAFIKLASGNNSITLTLTGTVGTCSCEMVFRKRYL